jgi:hypothetical protein
MVWKAFTKHTPSGDKSLKQFAVLSQTKTMDINDVVGCTVLLLKCLLWETAAAMHPLQRHAGKGQEVSCIEPANLAMTIEVSQSHTVAL